MLYERNEFKKQFQQNIQNHSILTLERLSTTSVSSPFATDRHKFWHLCSLTQQHANSAQKTHFLLETETYVPLTTQESDTGQFGSSWASPWWMGPLHLSLRLASSTRVDPRTGTREHQSCFPKRKNVKIATSLMKISRAISARRSPLLQLTFSYDKFSCHVNYFTPQRCAGRG